MTSQSGNDSNDPREPSDPAGSGNRWEPPAGPQDGSVDETAEQPTLAQPVQQPEPAEPQPGQDEQPVRRSRTAVLRKQAPVAAVGAVFLLGGGVAGYALGHATAGDGVGPTGRHATTDGGQPGPGDGFGPGRHGQWQQGPGQGEGGPGLGPGRPPQGNQGDGPGGTQDGSNGQDSSGTPS